MPFLGQLKRKALYFSNGTLIFLSLTLRNKDCELAVFVEELIVTVSQEAMPAYSSGLLDFCP